MSKSLLVLSKKRLEYGGKNLVEVAVEAAAVAVVVVVVVVVVVGRNIWELTNRRLLFDDAVWSRHFSRRRPAETGVYDSQRTRRRRCGREANFPPFF